MSPGYPNRQTNNTSNRPTHHRGFHPVGDRGDACDDNAGLASSGLILKPPLILESSDLDREGSNLSSQLGILGRGERGVSLPYTRFRGFITGPLRRRRGPVFLAHSQGLNLFLPVGFVVQHDIASTAPEVRAYSR